MIPEIIILIFVLCFGFFSARRVHPRFIAPIIEGGASIQRRLTYKSLLWRTAVFSGSIVCLIAAANAQIERANLQFQLLWMLGLLLLICVFFFRSPRGYRLIHRGDWKPMALIFFIALAIRLWFFSFSEIVHFEAVWGRDLLRFVSGEKDSFFSWVGDFPANTPTITMLWAYYLFPDNPYMYLRFPMVLQGALCAAFAFITTRQIFNSTVVGCLTGFAWAVSAWTVNESSYACTFTTYQLGLWIMLALTTIAFRSQSNPATAMALGITAGMHFNMLYVHMTSFIAIYALLMLSFVIRSREDRRTILSRGAIFTLGLIAAVLPTAIRYFVFEPNLFHRHIGNVTFQDYQGSPTFSHIAGTAWRVIKNYFFPIDPSAQAALFHESYWPPVLDPVSNYLFLFGLGVAILFFYRSWPFYLNCLFAITFFPVIFRSASYYRLSGLAPIMFIYIALALAVIILLVDHIKIKRTWPLTAAGFIFLLTMGWFNFGVLHEALGRKLAHDRESYEKSVLNAVGREMLARHEDCSFRITGLHIDNQNLSFFKEAVALKGNRSVTIVRDLRELIEHPDSLSTKDVCYIITESGHGLSSTVVKQLLQKIYPESAVLPLKNLSGQSVDASLVFVPYGEAKSVFIYTSEDMKSRMANFCLGCSYEMALIFPTSGDGEIYISDELNSVRISNSLLKSEYGPVALHILEGIESTVVTTKDVSSQPLLEWADHTSDSLLPLPFLLVNWPNPVQTTVTLEGVEKLIVSSPSLSEICDSQIFRQLSSSHEITKSTQMRVPTTGEYIIRTEGNMKYRLYIDKSLIFSADGESGSHNHNVELEKGDYLLRIVFPPQDYRRHCFYIRWKMPGSSTFEEIATFSNRPNPHSVKTPVLKTSNNL